MATRYSNQLEKSYDALTPEEKQGYGSTQNFNQAVQSQISVNPGLNEDAAIGNELTKPPVRRYTSALPQPATNPTQPAKEAPIAAPAPAQPSGTPFGTGDQVANSYVDNLRDYNPETDEEAIKEKARQEMQATIDAINAKYVSIFADETRKGEDRSGQTRSISSRSGTLGSDFGNTDRINTDNLNKDQMALKQSEKAIELSKADAAWKEQAKAEIEARRAEALGKYNAVQEAQQKALSNLPMFAKAYPNLTPAQKQALMKQTGLDEFSFDAMFNASKPESAQIKYEYHTVKNADGSESVIAVGIDPATGKMVKQSYDNLETGGQPIKVYDGKPYFETTDAEGNIVLKLASGFQDEVKAPETKEVNGSLYERNPKTGTWDKVVDGGGDGDEDKPLSSSEISNYRAMGYDVQPGMTLADVKGMSRGLSEDEKKIATEESAILAENSGKVGALQEKVTLIDSLLNHQGMKGTVGAYGVGRFTPFSPDKSARSEFIAGVNQLISQETIDTLITLKERGGTLGALSDQERAMLQSAASKIGTWMMRDDKGKTTGFEVSEKAFKKELETLKRLTQTAIEKASAGNPNTPTSNGGGANGDDPLGIGAQGDPLGLGFNPAPSTALNGSSLGALSSRYESTGDPGIVGWDSVGGTSYGTYQLIPSNADKFVRNSEFADYFKGQQVGTPQFEATWKNLAKTYPDKFAQAQEGYIEQTHYAPQVQQLASKGYDLSNRSDALKQVIWSTAVQHGPKTDVIEQAFKKVGKNATDEQLINAIYDERWSDGRRFASSTQQVKNSVYNRFFGPQGEKALALGQLKNSRTA